jgi:hypothetical protein
MVFDGAKVWLFANSTIQIVKLCAITAVFLIHIKDLTIKLSGYDLTFVHSKNC